MTGSIPHGVFDVPRPAKRLRVYVGESDRWHGKPLYEAIVIKARSLHLAGATVLRSPMGFGANSRIHSATILRLSEDLPIVVEIIDNPARIAELMPFLKEAMRGGLVTIEDVGIAIYNPDESPEN
jgi:PII-like signaling protein